MFIWGYANTENVFYCLNLKYNYNGAILVGVCSSTQLIKERTPISYQNLSSLHIRITQGCHWGLSKWSLKDSSRSFNLQILPYFVLVFTKSVNSNFCTFWLALITQNSLGHSLFCNQSQDGISFWDIFDWRNSSDKWRSTNKYQECDKLWPVSVYW